MTRLAALLLVLLASGCTRGTLFGIVRVAKDLEGTIQDDVYTAPDGSFSVAVPHPETTYEYSYMQAQEQFSERGTFLWFGPAAFDRRVYYLAVPSDDSVEFDRIAAEMTARMRRQFERVLGTELMASHAYDDTISGHPARYTRYAQVAPAGVFASVETMLVHDAWVIDFGGRGACAWVQTPRSETREEGLSPRAFAESVVVR